MCYGKYGHVKQRGRSCAYMLQVLQIQQNSIAPEKKYKSISFNHNLVMTVHVSQID